MIIHFKKTCLISLYIDNKKEATEVTPLMLATNDIVMDSVKLFTSI